MPTIYITAPQEAATEIAQTLVEERLAACVNRVACDSIYRWEGEIHTDAEEILLAKTTADRYPDLRDRVVELHPYEVPCIERFDETDIFAPFSDWRTRNVDAE
ncbi:divalent-cation tolerance protein CutA (plasmid) [Haloarcula sp. KBTZ06]|uniref:divalent-cation tolerance protein CutA n=1 Tax=unclassified Haloarcula TaxID=2624677 RepID=UPI0005955AA8|nr:MULTISPECIES: divalent-cation tolerance protein CutA [unclassified Haloarcula]AJF24506.1 divalent cation transporter [Haloarcula sp. CBA1115]KAA9401099.1 divalent-cation tolerance protein CutA [Haloarcula sp. CBA1131]KZX48279.1 divalent cation transporter [Haloarcula sp. K1]